MLAQIPAANEDEGGGGARGGPHGGGGPRGGGRGVRAGAGALRLAGGDPLRGREQRRGLRQAITNTGHDNVQIIAFARRYRDDLDKVMAPTPPLKNTWIVPGGPYYKGQWIWDTMFVVDLLSILPGKKKLIRDIFQNYWDFQDRWNKEMPDYAHDMIPCMIVPGNRGWVEFPAYSQIPILAWGVERVYKRNRDRELVRQCLEPLERFHEWYWRERDVTQIGLVAVGAYVDRPLRGAVPAQHAHHHEVVVVLVDVVKQFRAVLAVHHLGHELDPGLVRVAA